MRTTLLLVTLTLSSIGSAGCGGDAGCPELCAKEAECNASFGLPPVDEESCTSECEALSADDAAYADAVAEQAACLDSIDTCNDYFSCQYSGE